MIIMPINLRDIYSYIDIDSYFVEYIRHIEKSAKEKLEIADLYFILCPHFLFDAEFLRYEVNITFKLRVKYGLWIDPSRETYSSNLVQCIRLRSKVFTSLKIQMRFSAL
jgi:hypothetical protein